MKKKLQVFISSTFTDLQSERQAAVQAVLDAGHIPAGMELFRAGNESQMSTIKKWIDNSDVYMLILGGRYGSLDSKTNRSYTQLEYEYAISKKMPVFAVVLSESYLHIKAAHGENVFEKDNKELYEIFKKTVLSKLVKFVDDEKDIKLAVHGTLADFLNEYELTGWVRGSDTEDTTATLKENAALSKENARLLKEINALNEKLAKASEINKNLFGDFTFDELTENFESKKITISAEVLEGSEEIEINALLLFMLEYENFSTGVENSIQSKKYNVYLYYRVAPFYMAYGIMEKVKVAGAKYERIQVSKLGMRFYTRLEKEGYTDFLKDKDKLNNQVKILKKPQKGKPK